MRQLSILLSALFFGLFNVGSAFAEDAPSDAAAPAAEAPAAPAADSPAAPAAEAPAAPTAAAKPAVNLKEMNAKESYNYFIGLLRACGSNPDGMDGVTGTCDKKAIWDAIDAESKLKFVAAYGALVGIDRMITTYFDAIEVEDMRKQTGTGVLKEHNLTNAVDLFEYMFKTDKLVFTQPVIDGMGILKVIEDPKRQFETTIVTNCSEKCTEDVPLGLRQFQMVKESDQIWRFAGLHDVFDASLQPIITSETEMRKYAKDNFEAEINRRKKVLEYFIFQKRLREAGLR